MVKDLLKRSGFYAFFLLIGRGLTLVLFIILARILLPKGFGDAVLFVTLNQFFTSFADFGLNQWYMKQADLQDKNQLFKPIIRNIFILTGMLVFSKNLALDVIISIYLISTILNLLIIFPWKIIIL